MASLLLIQHQRPDGEVDTYHLKAGRRYHIGRGSQCQIRILDLKLSRQHCALEFLEGVWHVVDLASTNGCSLDGNRVSGSVPIAVGGVIQAGQSTLTVVRIMDQAEDPPEEGPLPEPVRSEPPSPSERLAAVAAQSDRAAHDDLEPAPLAARGSEPLMRGPAEPSAPPPVRRPEQVRTPVPDHLSPTDQDGQATLTPGTKPPAPPSEEPGSRSYFINVLGKRVGPLTRGQARDLKARELKGALTPNDLSLLEKQIAAETAPPAPTSPAATPPKPLPAVAAGPEEATYYVTLLGKRVGPLTRTQARDLKARELKGTLDAAEVDRLAASHS